MFDASISAVRQTSRERSKPAVHMNAALAFITDGAARFEQRMIWALEPGDLVVVPAGEPHRFVDGTTESWALGFHAASLADADRQWLLDPFDRVRRGGSAVVRIAVSRQSFVERLFQEVERTKEPRAAASLLTLILHEVREASALSSVAPGSTRSDIVADSLAFIEQHCLGRLTLRDVANAVGRTPAHVTTAVKRATGRTVGEWIIEGRMHEARRMLLQSNELVDGIAERVGYADPTHFIRMFRRAHGVTPAQWRSTRG